MGLPVLCLKTITNWHGEIRWTRLRLCFLGPLRLMAKKGALLYCPTAFTAPAQGTFATGDYGNASSNPGFVEWNLAVHKQFPPDLS